MSTHDLLTGQQTLFLHDNVNYTEVQAVRSVEQVETQHISKLLLNNDIVSRILYTEFDIIVQAESKVPYYGEM